MFQSLHCMWKGHQFVDSRSQPGTRVCLRCSQRRLFEGLEPPAPPGTGQR